MPTPMGNCYKLKQACIALVSPNHTTVLYYWRVCTLSLKQSLICSSTLADQYLDSCTRTKASQVVHLFSECCQVEWNYHLAQRIRHGKSHQSAAARSRSHHVRLLELEFEHHLWSSLEAWGNQGSLRSRSRPHRWCSDHQRRISQQPSPEQSRMNHHHFFD
jgi:hypothetical protein